MQTGSHNYDSRVQIWPQSPRETRETRRAPEELQAGPGMPRREPRESPGGAPAEGAFERPKRPRELQEPEMASLLKRM